MNMIYKRFVYEPQLLFMVGIMRRVCFVISLLMFFSFCHAQNNAWLQGTWKGKSYLPGSDATQYFSLILRVTGIKENKFEGYLGTMEPYDTTIRYDAKINGEFFGDYITIKSTKVFYVRNAPGSKWLLSCINCKPPKMTFELKDGKFSLKGVVDECYPQCVGIREFTKDINELSDKDQDSLYALVHMPKPQNATATVTAPVIKDTPVVTPVKEEVAVQRTPLVAAGDITKTEKKNTALLVPRVKEPTDKKSTLVIKDNERKKYIVPDTLAVVAVEKPVINTTVPVLQDPASLLPKGYSERKVAVIRTIPVNTDSITIRVYDNGVVDGDIVSVVYNDKVVIDKLSLISRAFELKIPVKPESINTLVFYAHNLGEFPPNTAKLEIIYGSKREELTISSDYTVSSSVNIVYTK